MSEQNGKEIKYKDVWKISMDVWETIVEHDSEKTYVDNGSLIKIVCMEFSKISGYMETTILRQMVEKVVWYWTDHIVNIRNTMTNIV